MKVIATVLSFLVVMFLFWYGGMEFLERGFMPAYMTFVSMWIAYGVWSFYD